MIYSGAENVLQYRFGFIHTKLIFLFFFPLILYLFIFFTLICALGKALTSPDKAFYFMWSLHFPRRGIVPINKVISTELMCWKRIYCTPKLPDVIIAFLLFKVFFFFYFRPNCLTLCYCAFLIYLIIFSPFNVWTVSFSPQFLKKKRARF